MCNHIKHHTVKKLLLFCCLSLVFFSCRKTEVTPSHNYDNQQLGNSANDLLGDTRFTTVVVQVQYMTGYKLEQDAIDHVTAFLSMLCKKPGGITITQTQIGATGDTLDPTKVAMLEKQHRTAYTSGTTIALYILVTDGVDTSKNTLGFAYRNTSLCLFGKTIANNSGGFGKPTRIALESNVLAHEIGHILGLINVGSPMVVNHEDPDHSKHCNNPLCIMYYSIELNGGGVISDPGRILELDYNCRNDLRANGGR
jgi:hypothetical protein